MDATGVQFDETSCAVQEDRDLILVQEDVFVGPAWLGRKGGRGGVKLSHGGGWVLKAHAVWGHAIESRADHHGEVARLYRVVQCGGVVDQVVDGAN
jgi:hypothetical protein